MLTDRDKFNNHKCRAVKRKDRAGNQIEFRLTFDEWITWWHNTGHYAERGNKRGQYVMARKNDLGHYELGNIECKTVGENIREGHLGSIRSSETRQKMSAIRKKRPIRTSGFLGKTHSDKSKYKMSVSRKGVSKSEETRSKMSAARKSWWDRRKQEIQNANK